MFCQPECFLKYKRSQSLFNCLARAVVALMLGVKNVQGQDWRYLNVVNDDVLVSKLLALRILCTFFLGFYCWLRIYNCLRSFYLFWCQLHIQPLFCFCFFFKSLLVMSVQISKVYFVNICWFSNYHSAENKYTCIHTRQYQK